MRSMASSGSINGGGDENERDDSQNLRKPYHRHSPDQIQRLEEFYKRNAHPDEKQRRQIGTELGLEPRQIKFWFQNKRTQIKTQKERADNDAMRSANEALRNENLALMKSLKYVTCGPCGGAPATEEARQHIFQNLEQENVKLKLECDRVSSMLTKYTEMPLSGPETNSADQMNPNPELEELRMTEIAASSMDELIKLLRVDQPLWIKSPTEQQYVLDYDCYYENVTKTMELKFRNSRMESSKDFGVVPMDAKFLVDLYLDPEKWVDLFPTLFSKAKTLSVLSAGLLDNRSNSLQLIHEQMHVLSPLMCQREFFLLRYCQQMKTGTWVIVDVSCDSFKNASNVTSTFCWKYPSGCMIEEMPNGFSKVTCVEHVEVDEDFLVHPIYEDLVKSTLAFGAKSRITTLQRACERYSFMKEAGIGDDDLARGRRGMIMLASKMIKGYCSIFSLFETEDVNQLSELTNNRVQIAVRKNTCPDQPVGIVIQAACSFWVPASPERVFSYLNDHMLRSQWDVFCNGCEVFEAMQISTGHHSSNAISILQPHHPREDFMIFQERAVGPLGSLLVYAPVDTSTMLELATGVGSPQIPILGSGFAITPDGPDGRGAPSSSKSEPCPVGSVVTAAFQILASNSVSVEHTSIHLLPTANAFVSHVVGVVRNAFDCSD